MRKPQRPEDFEKFYYAKVGLGEGCGCAEKVIDVHEFDRLAGKSRLWRPTLPRPGAWRRFLNKAGLTSRPKG
ncbi:MAG: hypothetical protein WBV71_19355 [Roseobacter sp.]